MFEFINVLKAIGALLITNSHFDNLYPIAALSIGGSLGNVCFFLAAGYCLSNKISSRGGTLINWMYSRAKRIYPALWIAITLFAVVGEITLTWNNLLTYYLFPYNSFWFISAIMICYLLMYYVVKYFDDRLWIVECVVIAIYFVFYFSYLDLTKWSVEGPDFFKYIFYFGVMNLGYVLKKKKDYIAQIDKKKLFVCSGILVVLSLSLYLVTKIVLMRYPILYRAQFLVQVFTLAFGLSVFFFLYSVEGTLKKWSKKKWYKIITYISASTLEIYLVNYVFVEFCSVFIFPLNIMIAFVLIGGSGIVLHTVIVKTQYYIWKK